MSPHPLIKFEIQKYYQNEPKFNDVYSINNLTKIKDGAYSISPDEFKLIITNCITSNLNCKNIIYFDSFGAAYILEEIKKFIQNKIS